MTNLMKLIEVLNLALTALNEDTLADALIYFEQAFNLKQQAKKEKQQKQQQSKKQAFAVDGTGQVQRILFEKPNSNDGLNLRILTEETTRKSKKYQTIYRSPTEFNNADLGPLDRQDFDNKGFRKVQ